MNEKYLSRIYRELKGINGSLAEHLISFGEYLISEYSLRPGEILEQKKVVKRGITLKEELEIAEAEIERLSREVRFLEGRREHLQDMQYGTRKPRMGFFGR